MPLPKINTPTYEMELPSSGKKVKYRPFLVKEEKILLIALETEDMKQISDGLIQILNNCIITRGVKVQSLATFDIEYLFLNVRARSVGETVEIQLSCPDDGETTVDVEIDIDLIKVQKSKEHKNIIKLDDAYSMKLRYPSFEQFIGNNFEINDNVSDVTKSLDMITSCIEMVYDKEESWSASECSKKELTEFVDQLNSKQFKEIEKFFETMPKLSHTVKVKNPNTNVESDVVLEGLASFFS
jgi:hypothetical protein|tara:strand:- start:6273 stop:6995 length:723 start_codon:yes stop_codon:yes gene_type:complete